MTSRYALSILDFSLVANPQPQDLMAILRAYGDESGKASDVRCRCISFAAIIGSVEQWKKFNHRWNRMLRRHSIPYLHMKEVVGGRASGKGPFARFADDAELWKLLSDAAACITSTSLFCSGLSVWLDDLQRVLERHKLAADPYAFTLYQAIVGLGTWALNEHPARPAYHLIIDRLENGTSRAAEAEQLYRSDTFAAWRGWPAVTPLSPKQKDGSKEMLELQAADFVAWLLRRDLLYVERWMREIKPAIGINQQSKWDESLWAWLDEREAEDAVARPENRYYYKAYKLLGQAKLLKHYPYDEERLEIHIMQNRGLECDPMLKARTIELAGEFPLTP